MDRLTQAYYSLAAVGIAIAIYHAYDELTETFNFCNLSKQISCGNVFASGDTSIFGIPFYALGLLWFPLLILLGYRLMKGGVLRGDVLLPVLMVGNAFTAYLWYLELFVIGAVCPVCISLYVVNYLLTALVIVAVVRTSDDKLAIS